MPSRGISYRVLSTEYRLPRSAAPVIIVMRQQVSPEEIQEMVAVVEAQGMKPHILYGVERTVIAAVGPEREGMKESFEQGRGVEEVLPILAPYKVASREVKKDT